MIKKSPSGSACPYYFMNGELHPLKYGSFRDDKDKLFSIMKAEEEFILKSPGQNNRRIWIDLYETKLDREVIDALISHLQAIRHKIYNLCLVGCSSGAQRAIKRAMRKAGTDLYLSTRYFSDPEMAKLWLLGKFRD